jgi:pimeloyl-ACP methyl ester carboxylesterase
MANFYWIHFQELGVAEAEFERDVDASLRKILFGLSSGVRDGERRHPLDLPPGMGLLDVLTAPDALPPWMSEEELSVFVAQFRRAGFRGGLNWYRNIDRNWELLAPWAGATIAQPALFIAGSRDPVIRGTIGERALTAMDTAVPGLKRKLILEGAGHWIQQERPAEVTAELLRFLREL